MKALKDLKAIAEDINETLKLKDAEGGEIKFDKLDNEANNPKRIKVLKKLIQTRITEFYKQIKAKKSDKESGGGSGGGGPPVGTATNPQTLGNLLASPQLQILGDPLATPQPQPK